MVENKIEKVDLDQIAEDLGYWINAYIIFERGVHAVLQYEWNYLTHSISEENPSYAVVRGNT